MKIIMYDEWPNFQGISAMAHRHAKELSEYFTKIRLQKKKDIQKQPFPFNLFSDCIDKDGTLRWIKQ